MAWDPFRGNYLRPDFRGEAFAINSEGRRGAEFDASRPKVLVCMGDSSTFGLWSEGVENRKIHFDSYPELLAEELDRGGYKDWQVVNAGVPGSTAVHSLRILRREILPLDPEIVTLRVGVNDHALRRAPFVRDPDHPVARRLLYTFGEWRLFHLLAQAWFNLRPSEPPKPMASEVEFRRDLSRFVDLARDHGIRLAFIDYPLRPPRETDPVAAQTAGFWGGTDVATYYEVHDRYQFLLRQVARSKNVPLLVTAPRMLEEARFGFSDDIVHPSATGMSTIASMLFRFLVDRGWLDDPTLRDPERRPKPRRRAAAARRTARRPGDAPPPSRARASPHPRVAREASLPVTFHPLGLDDDASVSDLFGELGGPDRDACCSGRVFPHAGVDLRSQ